MAWALGPPWPYLEVTFRKPLYLAFLIQKMRRQDMVMIETPSGSLSVELSGT